VLDSKSKAFQKKDFTTIERIIKGITNVILFYKKKNGKNQKSDILTS